MIPCPKSNISDVLNMIETVKTNYIKNLNGKKQMRYGNVKIQYHRPTNDTESIKSKQTHDSKNIVQVNLPALSSLEGCLQH